MNPKNEYTMDKAQLLVRIAGLPDSDARIPALAAILLGGPQQSGPAPLRLFPMGKAAEAMGCSRPTLWRMIRDGQVRTVELKPGMRRVPESELRRIAAGAK